MQNTKNKENVLNLTVQYFGKYGSTVQQMAYRGIKWTGKKIDWLEEEVGDGRAEKSSAIADRW